MNEKEIRLEKANKLLEKIASCGRNFFYYDKDDTTAKFLLKNNRVYFMDQYTKKEMLTYNYRQLKRHFNNGGTMRALVMDISEWIRTGKYTNGNNGYGGLFCPHWGYSKADMLEIQELARGIGYLKEREAE